MPDSDQITNALPQRLCSEIQLFDLCDLVSCNHKSGRFCTGPVLLDRFEKIIEDELRVPERFLSEDTDDAEADGGEGYNDGDDGFAEENFDGDENNGWEDEE